MPAAVLFFDATLAPLGLRRFTTPGAESSTGWAGWGTAEAGVAQALALWICTPFNGRAATAGNGTMVALRAQSWGRRSAPGLRPQYGEDCYAAYVRDPDGNKLAAVCRGLTAAP